MSIIQRVITTAGNASATPVSISSTILALVSPVRPDKESLIVEAIRKLRVAGYQRLVDAAELEKRPTTEQYDEQVVAREAAENLIATHAAELEQRPTVEQYQEEVAAREAAEECITSLSEVLQAIVAEFKETQAALQGELEEDQQALQDVCNERDLAYERIYENSRANRELQERCASLEDVVGDVQKKNCDLQIIVGDLRAIVAGKDEQILTLTKDLDEAAPKYSNFEQYTTRLEEQKKLTDLFAEQKKSWGAREEELTHLTCIAQAENRENHKAWVKILDTKITQIADLGVAVALALTGDLTGEKASASYKRYIGTNQELRKSKAGYEKSIKEYKTNIQNLLVRKQADSELLTEYRKEIRELQAERTEAQDEVKKLSHQLEKRNKYVIDLQKIIGSQATTANENGASCDDSCVPLAIDKHMVAQGLAEYYMEAETLRGKLQEEQEKCRDIQAKLDACDTKLYDHQIVEEKRLAEMTKLENKVTTLEAAQEVYKQRIEDGKALIFATNNPTHPDVLKICDTLNIEKHKEDALEVRANAERDIGAWRNQYKDFEDYFWDVAVTTNDNLHKELAEWKSQCGKQHFWESRPASRLVHDRCILHYAIAFGREGYAIENLPPEYKDKQFLRGFHPAVECALRKLRPQFWKMLCVEDKEKNWIELTVPILTGEGSIVLDAETLAVSNGRLEEFRQEIKVLDEQLEEDHRRRFSMEDESDDDDYDESFSDGSSEGGYEDESTSEDGETTRSHSPSSNDTNDTSPPPSNSTSPESEQSEPEHESECLNHGIDYDDAVSREVEDENVMPAFMKKKQARVIAQEEINEHLAGYVADEEINQEAFLAQYGQRVDGLKSDDANNADKGEDDHGNKSAHSDESVHSSETVYHDYAAIKPHKFAQSDEDTHGDDCTNDELTFEQRVTIEYVDGQHNESSRYEYEVEYDDAQKSMYREITLKSIQGRAVRRKT